MTSQKIEHRDNAPRTRVVWGDTFDALLIRVAAGKEVPGVSIISERSGQIYGAGTLRYTTTTLGDSWLEQIQGAPKVRAARLIVEAEAASEHANKTRTNAMYIAPERQREREGMFRSSDVAKQVSEEQKKEAARLLGIEDVSVLPSGEESMRDLVGETIDELRAQRNYSK